MNEEIIQDIFRSCPFITDFGLIGCYGLKTLDISKLPKLCSVDVYSLAQTVENVRVEAANLEYFKSTTAYHIRLKKKKNCKKL